MSPSILKTNQVSTDADFDLQKWLKEIEGAENLMNEVETKADNLQAKVDALLLEVGQPFVTQDLDNTIQAVQNVTLDSEKQDKQQEQ
ncbi:uncharacterized protein EV154DRAFT_524944 [Mucor mucedo]|uniref:uncharacterized protein n=1 Tax=Mucor mucedo TaxID=29922 RepID=UPI00221F03F9|nr:uncharacterized protein EV154DRAFT_524944 [Mucor mucedo]KAI7878726.1 hypothetical protein EV154DRAFT_524944 [Mucor mucedo]